jgi:hypothetical protein
VSVVVVVVVGGGGGVVVFVVVRCCCPILTRYSKKKGRISVKLPTIRVHENPLCRSGAVRQIDMDSNRILPYSASKAPSQADGSKHTMGIIQTARAYPLIG